MAISITKEEALQELQYLKETWKTPPFDFPMFVQELDFITFFIYMLQHLQDAGNNNILRFITKHLERGLDDAFAQICRILDKHTVDGSDIYNLMVERKFILRGDKRAYNRKVPGKWPKGLTSDAWNNYNNLLAAGIMWKGFIKGHDPEYKVHIVDTHDIDARIEDLLRPDYKPLWAMKQAYDNAGRPANGRDMDSVELRPMAIWVQYMKGLEVGAKTSQ